MQYLLTENEYWELQEQAQLIDLGKEDLQKLCTEIAENMPIKRPYEDDTEIPRPWGCLLTYRKNGQEFYCDLCPVQLICPYGDKDYSQ